MIGATAPDGPRALEPAGSPGPQRRTNSGPLAGAGSADGPQSAGCIYQRAIGAAAKDIEGELNGDSAYSLRCTLCGTGTGPIARVVRCEHCNGVLEVSYSVFPDGRSARLPLLKPGVQISLGEGNTPEVSLHRAADALGLGELRAKLEFMAPTGSFKDRGSALLVSLARQEGVQGFVEDSSGNAGASLSAYAAAAGMNAHIFVPSTAASGKLDQIRIFGATLHAVEGPRQAATEAAQEFVRESGLPYLSHSLSPFFSEGMKPFAYEVTGHGGEIPDHIVLPVGNGSLLIGARAGFAELLTASVIARVPKFHAVQMENVCPVAAAINGEDWNPSQAAPTVASGIAVSAPPRLAQ